MLGGSSELLWRSIHLHPPRVCIAHSNNPAQLENCQQGRRGGRGTLGHWVSFRDDRGQDCFSDELDVSVGFADRTLTWRLHTMNQPKGRPRAGTPPVQPPSPTRWVPDHWWAKLGKHCPFQAAQKKDAGNAATNAVNTTLTAANTSNNKSAVKAGSFGDGPNKKNLVTGCLHVQRSIGKKP